ncbi:DUF4395 domain-containing protein [Catellatospora citrea]|uniref:Membrane protein n=1 Tax=Catellatospora citrea TaxID=53366 RepID=A0A8J3KJ01_9ACTN|nr:DUF4395 domain-containing protein [Catellatospora citrea]RKE11694.1 uncharacterized protein DUF4395 [Catellatospora citrea]GIF99743.1 membrane protein [Catellatospora citrea]
MTDPRGPRFAAAVTTVVMVAVLLTGSGWLALAQAAVFALTAAQPRLGPYGLIYRTLLAPRLGKPAELEPLAPVRFAQAVGFVFAAVATLGYLFGSPLTGAIAASFALAAAFLNAAFGLCLGCELFLAYRRLTGRPLAARVPAS